MYTYTVVCFGAEIGFGEGETFEQAKREAEAQAMTQAAWYPRDEWGYITRNPAGMTVSYNTVEFVGMVDEGGEQFAHYAHVCGEKTDDGMPCEWCHVEPNESRPWE